MLKCKDLFRINLFLRAERFTYAHHSPVKGNINAPKRKLGLNQLHCTVVINTQVTLCMFFKKRVDRNEI